MEWLTSGAAWGGLAVGFFGGIISGLLGVSSGGILVPGLALVLGLDQHRAQAVSLVAQLLPTGLPGAVEYHRQGHRLRSRQVLLASVGFLAGAYAGASLAGGFPERPLRWLFAGYLVALATTMVLGGRPRAERVGEAPRGEDSRGWDLLVVGACGGLSSGLLGIGGGLAMTVLMVAWLGLPQHRAQALSLVVTILPTGLPAIWVYLRREAELPWPILGGVVVGLLVGTTLGAAVATRLEEPRLRRWFIGLVLLLAGLMIARSLR
jgi:uncharacterized membrane protein YfcA